jgi:IPT/TIG domain-containing protein
MRYLRRSGRGVLVFIAIGGGCGVVLPADRVRAAEGPPGWLSGQSVYVADSDKDLVLCLTDRDGSGSIESGDREPVPFYNDSSPGPDLSVPSALLAGPGGEIYLLDGGTLDAIYVLTDADGDGRALGEGEWRVFYDDTSSGPNFSTPNAMALGADGTVFVADNGRGNQRILRLTDTNGDGDALDEGEWQVVYDKTARSPAGGPLLGIEALAVLPQGSLLAADSLFGRIYLLTDRNGDHDFLDDDEARVFYDPQGAHPFSSLEGLAVGPDGAVYAADSATGLVMKLSDRDSNGDAMGSGEATVFLDPSLPPKVIDVGDLAVAPDGTVVVVDRKANSVVLARDLDGDGSANGDGETVGWLVGGGLLTTPSAVAIAPAAPEAAVSISRVDPASGPLSGGTPVHIEGRFDAPESAAVTFAGLSAAVVSAAPTVIECVAPAGIHEGPVDVRVATSAGEAVLRGAFRYRTTSFIRGDGNGDGAVDISDAVAILAYLYLGGASPDCMDALDTDDDGTLSITDPIYLLNFLFQDGSPIPAPGPEPGFDGTPDGLQCEGA